MQSKAPVSEKMLMISKSFIVYYFEEDYKLY